MSETSKTKLNEETFVGSDWAKNCVDQVLNRPYVDGDWLAYINSFEFPDSISQIRTQALFNSLKDFEPSKTRILDVGVNNGLNFSLLASIGFQVIGLDINRNNVIQMQKRFPGHKVLQGDLNFILPLEDSTFDVIWAGEVLEHVPNTDNALSELTRVLRERGRFLLTVPYHGKLKNILIAFFSWERHFDPFFPHFKFFTISTLTRALSRYGFEILSVRLLGRCFPVNNVMFFDAKKGNRN